MDHGPFWSTGVLAWIFGGGATHGKCLDRACVNTAKRGVESSGICLIWAIVKLNPCWTEWTVRECLVLLTQPWGDWLVKRFIYGMSKTTTSTMRLANAEGPCFFFCIFSVNS